MSLRLFYIKNLVKILVKKVLAGCEPIKMPVTSQFALESPAIRYKEY